MERPMSDATDSQLIAGISELKDVINQLRSELMRKDVYEREREMDKAAVAVVVDDVKEIKDTLRWVVRGFLPALLLPLVTSFVILYVSQQVGK